MPVVHGASTVYGDRPGVCWLTQAQPIGRVGAKFHSLSRLFRRGLPVPPAFCVPLEVLSHDRGQAIVERAARRLARISGAGLFAVRSSSVDEDDASGSRAGHYDTELSVRPAGVWAAVGRCAYPPAHDPIPTMVQAMIEPLQSGVLFTQHPLISVAGTALVEAVAGTADELVGGGQSASGRYVFLPAGGWRTEEGGGLPDDGLDALLRLGVNCEQIQGCGRDIEWAMDASGRIWLLQSRPITSLPVGLLTLAGGHAHAACHCVPGSGADPEKVLAREVADRMAARSQPADPYQVCPQRVYMFRNPSGARIRRSELTGLFDENFVELRREVLTVGELARVLSGGTGPDRARVKDFPVARVSGLSCVLTDGNVLIEYAAGAGLTVARGLAAASGLIVTPDGRVLRRWGCKQDEVLVFARRHRRIEPRPYGRKPRLDASAVRLVVDMTVEMAARVPTAVIEWWIVGRKIYLVDFAAESASIPGVPASDITWVSGESMRGRLIWIGDTEPLRQMCQQLGMEGAAALARKSDAAQTFGLDLPRDESMIIGSDLPAIPLFALAPLAAGFVFRSGSILCHLGTLLREAGVPAAIAPDHADAKSHGRWLELGRKVALE